MARRASTAALTTTVAALLVGGAAVSGLPAAHAADATVDLADATSFAVLAGSAVSNTGASVIDGDVGLSPGSSVTGFPPGLILGTVHVSDEVARSAQSAVTRAYLDAESRTGRNVTDRDLGTMPTLTPGVYEASSGMSLTGTVTLDAQGDPGAVFIFNAGSTLVTASNSKVNLVNGATACNVFWQVGSSATLGTGTDFAGTILALTSVTLTTGADIVGRALARNGAVTLDSNDITTPECRTVAPSPAPTEPTAGPSTTPTDGPTTTPTTAPSTAPTSATTPTSAPAASPPKAPGSPTARTGRSSGGGDAPPNTDQPPATPDSDVPSTRTTPTVPSGHPATGMGGTAPGEASWSQAMLALASTSLSDRSPARGSAPARSR